MKNRAAFFILALIMAINAISYGIIIPLTYPYAEKFGLGPVDLSMLIVAFSVSQFIAAPIIGRLSDKFGRKWLLLGCLFGSSLALFTMAFAPSAAFLYVARIIDGITGGTGAVAQASLADITSEKDRAKSFGILGAIFGLGFLLGPFIGGFFGQQNLSAPFILSGLLALFGTLLGLMILPETLPKELRVVKQRKPLFNFHLLFKALFEPFAGVLFMLTLIASVAQSAFIVGVQTFSYDVLNLSVRSFGMLLAGVGLVSVIMQGGLMKPIINWVGSKKKLLVGAFFGATLSAVGLFFTSNLVVYVIWHLIFTIFFAFMNPLVSGLLSERTLPEDQGAVMGLNQSYLSLGTIFGPLLAGLVVDYSRAGVFLLVGGLFAIGLFATRWLFVQAKPIDV